MSALDDNIRQVQKYSGYVLQRQDVPWHFVYHQIITNIVEGRSSRGSECYSRLIDMAFIRALMAVPRVERLLHPCGIVLEDFHFYHSESDASKSNVKNGGVFRFDLADSRFPLPLVLRRCTFAEALDFRRAHLGTLDLTRSTLPALMLQGARLDGRLILEKTHLAFGKAVKKFLPLDDAVRQRFQEVAEQHD